MKLINAALIAAGLFALLRFPLLQLAKAAWRRHDLEFKKSKGWWIAVIEEAGNISLVAALTFLILAVVAFYIDLHGSGGLQELQRSLNSLERLRAAMKWLSEFWGSWLLFLALAVFTGLWARAERHHFMEKFSAKVQEQVRSLQLVIEQHPDEWKKLEPTASMKTIINHLNQVRTEADSLNPTSPDYNKHLEHLKGAHNLLTELLVQIDFQRRIEFPWELPLPQATTFWGRIEGVFLTKGFLSDMKGVGKVFKYAALALTFAGLVGVKSESLEQLATTKIEALDSLHVYKSLEKSREERGKAIAAAQPQVEAPPQPPPQKSQTPFTPGEIAALRAFSQDSVRSFARNPIWPEIPRFDGSSERVREATVRFAILDQVRNPGYVEQLPPAKGSAEHAALRSYSRNAAHPDALTPAAESIFQEISSLPAPARQRFLNKVVSWYQNKRLSYTQAADVGELQATLVENFLGAVSPQAPEFTGILGEQLSEVLKEGIQTSGKNAFEMFRNVVVLRALTGNTPDQILTEVRELRPDTPYMTKAASRILKQKLSLFGDQVKSREDFLNSTEREIAGVGSSPEESADAVAALREIPDSARKGREIELANLVSDFDSEFPSRGTAVSDFAREKVLSAWGITNSNDAGARIERATNFDKLQSYSRVGGILFGRNPSVSRVDITGFSWETTNDSLSLSLKSNYPTNQFNLGTFKPYLVWQALAYAADQRTTVVTLLNASDIGRKQVMVHPAFRDTAFGCRLLAADQWIFHYTDPNPKDPRSSDVRRMIDRFEVESALYQRAWEALKNTKSDELLKITPRLVSYLRPSEVSPFEKAPQIQPELLRLAILCAATEGTNFDKCVSDKSTNATWASRLPEKKPQFGFVSQIRESDFRADESMDFLRKSAPFPKGVSPLELTVQMTINDTDHWEFPSFSTTGLPLVLNGLQKDGKTREVEEIQQLATLQRLFRAALSGELGQSFPTEKLVELSALSKSMDTQQQIPTPRWLIEGSNSETIEHGLSSELNRLSLRPHIVSLTPDTAMHVRPLLKTCTNALSGDAVELLTNDQLALSCPWSSIKAFVENDCRSALRKHTKYEEIEPCQIWSYATYGEQYVSSIHNLRLSLGAAKAIKAETIACPRP